MDFELSQDQKLLAKTAADFVNKASPVSRARKLRDDALGYEKRVWKDMAELGWLGAAFSEEAGGFGGSFVDVALLLEQFGKTLLPEPFVASVVLAGMALDKGGSAEQKERFLSPMIAGETSLAFAYAERDSRFDVTRANTSAKREGDAYVLSGQKVWVLNGHAADYVVVSAMLEGELALFVVERAAKGLSTTPLYTFDGRRAAHLALEGVSVPAAQRLTAMPAASLISWISDYGAAAAVAEGVGLTQRVLDMTVEYLNTREQFDVKIGSFQALQHRAVDMFIEVELLRSINFDSMVRVDSSDARERARAVSAAKVQLSVGGKLVTRQAIQLHGGVGCTDEHDIGLYFKRMQVLNTLFGDEEREVERFAESFS
jgi:alkylation response protein AidB-like acyl-CoA dehydrogenase